MERCLGYEIEGQIDHIDRNRLNNTRENPRVATRSLNGFNRDFKKQNSSGVRGVSRRENDWLARITCEWVVYTKSFKRKEDAVAWRMEQERILFPENFSEKP